MNSWKTRSYCWVICMVSAIGLHAQITTVTALTPMPKRVSNNAVTLADANGESFVYSFGGIDSTKLYSGINRHAFRYRISTDTWEQLPDIPDTLGKIASAASTVNGKIYLIGGYHVLANGNEISSNRTHVFDPETNAFLADAPPIPIPIDDHVQAVWRDSLIYVITGWSNSTNVPNVQVFNPTTNNWSVGTSTPNTNTYKAFGACGTIINDTIFYFGGASIGFNFPAQSTMRKGVIDPNDPTTIVWSQPATIVPIYRGMATTDGTGRLFLLGGAAVTYNYNGIAYNGSGGVEPRTDYVTFFPESPASFTTTPLDLPMDLRGIAEWSPTVKYLVGGMGPGQQTSNRLLRIEWLDVLEHPEQHDAELTLFPNPSHGKISIQTLSADCWIQKIEVFDVTGNEFLSRETIAQQAVSVELTEKGIYYIHVETNCGSSVIKNVVRF